MDILQLLLAVYLFILLVLGFSSIKRIRSYSDFLVAKKSLSGFEATLSLIATWFGAGSFIGVASMVYSGSLTDVTADPFAASFALIFVGIFLASSMHRSGAHSITEIVGRVYGRSLEIFCSVFMIPVYVGWIAALLLAIGHVLQDVFALPFQTSVVVSASLVASYTMAGGMAALTRTDVFNVFIFSIGLGLLLMFTIPEMDFSYFSTLSRAKLKFLPDHQPLSTTSFLGKWTVAGFGAMVGQDLAQRVFSCTHARSARRATVGAGIIYLLLGSLPIGLGLYAWQTMPGLANSDTVVLQFAKLYLPPWALAVFLVSLFAIALSSADSAALACGTLVAHNLFSGQCPRRKLILVRIAVVIACLIAATIALIGENVYQIMVHSWASLPVVIFVPVITALVTNPPGKLAAAWASVFAGFTVWVTCLGIHLFQGYSLDPSLYTAAFFGFIASISAYGLICLGLQLIKFRLAVKPS